MKTLLVREQAGVTSCGSIPSRIRKKTFPQVMRVVSFLRWDSDQKMVRLFLPIAGISRIRAEDQQASIMTQWCSRSVYSVEGISPDGQYLALVSYGLQGYVILLNINAGQIIGVYPASYVNNLRFQRMVERYLLWRRTG